MAESESLQMSDVTLGEVFRGINRVEQKLEKLPYVSISVFDTHEKAIEERLGSLEEGQKILSANDRKLAISLGTLMGVLQGINIAVQLFHHSTSK